MIKEVGGPTWAIPGPTFPTAEAAALIEVKNLLLRLLIK